ncbi:hypothetical protein GCM10010282_38140 [Streptomyces roseolus]|nr:hypothetical protein GCM10010282_38140 [Streptomyces roseolus]
MAQTPVGPSELRPVGGSRTVTVGPAYRTAAPPDGAGLRIPRAGPAPWTGSATSHGLGRKALDDGRDVGVGDADGYAEVGGDLRERVVGAQADQAYEGTLVRRELAASATPRGTSMDTPPL